MSKKYTLRNVKLDDLILDNNNPRFAELYTGSKKESDIIEYLLFSEAAKEIAEAISSAGEFYVDRPLWVFEEKGKYIVKDGNRRCSAVKALQVPNKYELDVARFEIKELPVLVYNSLVDLETRIRIEHNSGLFKKWGRIAKAIEIHRLFSSGYSLDSLTDIDSHPKELLKTASFYHNAIKIQGENFKKLVREGRGEKGGKTIIFERLFRERKLCGYTFKNTGILLIKDNKRFKAYITSMVKYLLKNPNVTSRTLDEIYKKKESFLDLLKPYGFTPIQEAKETESNTSQPNNSSQNQQNTNSNSNSTTSNNSNTTSSPSSTNSNSSSSVNNNNSNSSSSNNNGSPANSGSNTNTRHSVKNKPTLKRKRIPPALKKLIDECYNLDQNNFANSKTALTRITFECVLKFVVENTNQKNGKPIAVSNHFQFAFKDKKQKPLPYTNFTVLKTKFSELIKDTGIKKAFEVLDLEIPNQIIHNYRVGAIPKQAKDLCDNLIDIIEFMLQDEIDFTNSLDTSKL